MSESKAVIVTTAHRGVFFGYLNGDQDETSKSLSLTNCRNVIYWSSDTKGFLGLASDGPGNNSKIGATAPRVRLHDITSLADCTEKASKAFGAWE